MRAILVVFVPLAAAVPAALYLLSTPTSIAFIPAPKVIGTDTAIVLRLANPHGLRRVTAGVEQAGARYVLLDSSEPARRWLFWRRKEAPREVRLSAGQARTPALREGKAKLFVETQSNDFRAVMDSLAVEVEVVTQPPKLSVDGFQHYLNQGGAELVVFTVSGSWTEAGVRVGRHAFRSYPLPGSSKQERFCLFAFPWDEPAETAPLVFARNAAGAEVTAGFWLKVFPRRFRSRQLEVDDAFMNKVTAELDPGGAGGLLARFLRVNGDLRRANNRALADLGLKTEERFLWNEPFEQLGNSKVESQFADRRTYTYQGKKVDDQVHLGFDLSVTRNVAVSAANSGKVVHAAPLGIYGNCVVVDHGYGLQSIYAHLSSIEVKEGDLVKKGQPLGRSGSTGLAGGDHLHFSMQIDGVQVNPVEWWDGHWIQDRIRSKVRF
ncbi:MAG: M23 family metallopeptidase [Acidobacteria bacterium]|nr:M23 family metallopeptidase [Acidobacteriota bacterium]MBI3470076.1 M23 family metallopeptidase [Candidatus Solibacter usitatus]